MTDKFNPENHISDTSNQGDIPKESPNVRSTKNHYIIRLFLYAIFFLSIFLNIIYLIERYLPNFPFQLPVFFREHAIYSGILISYLCSLTAAVIIFCKQDRGSQEHETRCFNNQDKSLHILTKEQNCVREKVENLDRKMQDLMDLKQKFESAEIYIKEKEAAGIEKIFRSREIPDARKEVLDSFAYCMSPNRKNTSGTVCLIGTSLRNFTYPKKKSQYYNSIENVVSLYQPSDVPSCFTDPLTNNFKELEQPGYVNLIIRLLCFCPNMNIKMVVLNPYCLEAYFRAYAEKDDSEAFRSIIEYKREKLPNDIDYTIGFAKRILKINSINSRFQLRLSFFSNSMFLLLFPDFCLKQQYIMDDSTHVDGTSELPLVKHRKSDTDSPYKRLEWHFNFMWSMAHVAYDETNYAKGTNEAYLFNIYQEIKQ
jgi:hypothetical protein